MAIDQPRSLRAARMPVLPLSIVLPEPEFMLPLEPLFMLPLEPLFMLPELPLVEPELPPMEPELPPVEPELPDVEPVPLDGLVLGLLPVPPTVPLEPLPVAPMPAPALGVVEPEVLPDVLPELPDVLPELPDVEPVPPAGLVLGLLPVPPTEPLEPLPVAPVLAPALGVVDPEVVPEVPLCAKATPPATEVHRAAIAATRLKFPFMPISFS